MIIVHELSERPDLLERSINYFWECWGSDANAVFYRDCITHSLRKEAPIPKFYIGLEDDEIVCSYALLTNDVISRQDLMPWFACLFVNESHRKQGLAEMLLKHGLNESRNKGFDQLYLSTDLVNFYERKGWTEFGVGYGVMGDAFTIYSHPTGA